MQFILLQIWKFFWKFYVSFFYEKQHYLGSEMWQIKLQKIVGDLWDKFRKLYMNGNYGYREFLAVLK